MSSERLEGIGRGMQRLIDDGKIPGTVTMVARRGKVVHFDTLGYQDIESNTPMAKDTIFRIYSMTKPITSVALMMQNLPSYTYPTTNDFKNYVYQALID